MLFKCFTSFPTKQDFPAVLFFLQYPNQNLALLQKCLKKIKLKPTKTITTFRYRILKKYNLTDLHWLSHR